MSKYSEENISRIGNAAIYIAEHTSDLSKTTRVFEELFDQNLEIIGKCIIFAAK